MKNEKKKNELAIIEKHRLLIRWAHWLNFPFLALMIWSGTMIYWANDVYTPFISEGLYEALDLDHHLAYGMGIHFLVMWFFALNGIIYVGFLLLSGEWRELWPKRRHFREAWQVLLHDLGLKRPLPPQGRYNAAQRIAYTAVVLMGGLSLLSGVAIYKPVQAHHLTTVLGGYEVARLIHFLLAVGFVLFFLIHVFQVIRAGWNNFRSMIVGAEVIDGRE